LIKWSLSIYFSLDSPCSELLERIFVRNFLTTCELALEQWLAKWLSNSTGSPRFQVVPQRLQVALYLPFPTFSPFVK